MMLIAGSEKIRKCSSDIPGFVTYFCSSNQNGVDLGKWLPVLCAPPHTTEQRRREVSHVYGKCSDLGSLRFQLMTLQLKLCNDKISKKQFNRGHSSAKKHRPGKSLWKRKRTADIMSGPLLKSWRSWPGFLLVACEGLSRLSWDHKLLFLIFHRSQSTKCAETQQEETLWASADQRATQKVPQSHKFMKRQLFFTWS